MLWAENCRSHAAATRRIRLNTPEPLTPYHISKTTFPGLAVRRICSLHDPQTPLNKMSICPGTGGKARNSGLLAKGAADWSAAGARLKDFLLKKNSESGLPSDISTLGGGGAN